MSNVSDRHSAPVPRGDAEGFLRDFRHDVVAGMLVFLIALPLCLGISLACGFPAIAGIFTAIIGSLVAPFLSNSELTIKGPAAGLIVVAIGAIEDFGGDGAIGGFSAADVSAYQTVLAIGFIAALIQCALGVCRAGVLGELFPLSAVHGMLAAIGVIIIAKQLPVAMGVSAQGAPLTLLAGLPADFARMNPFVGLIGGLSILIMFCWPLTRHLSRRLAAIPAPLAVLLVTIPLGMAGRMGDPHTYVFRGVEHALGEHYLVTMPDRIFGMFDSITLPDFARLGESKAWKWIVMFAVIGSLESVLSAKAVDLLDPWRRKSNLDDDLLAVGVGNVLSCGAGGLPMISEIVRSRANIDNGARTRFAGLWHGVFLLVCVALIPALLHHIPLAALAGMLVFTGFRLAHPREFRHVYHIGPEQLVVFIATLVGVLATDLLIGIGIGVVVELVVGLLQGASARTLFWSRHDVEMLASRAVLIRPRGSATFSNWLFLRRKLVRFGIREKKDIVIDFSCAPLVDHSVMKKLLELQQEMSDRGNELRLCGLEAHQRVSSDPSSACRSRRELVA